MLYRWPFPLEIRIARWENVYAHITWAYTFWNKSKTPVSPPTSPHSGNHIRQHPPND